MESDNNNENKNKNNPPDKKDYDSAKNSEDDKKSTGKAESPLKTETKTEKIDIDSKNANKKKKEKKEYYVYRINDKSPPPKEPPIMLTAKRKQKYYDLRKGFIKIKNLDDSQLLNKYVIFHSSTKAFKSKEFKKDENGKLIADDKGNPIQISESGHNFEIRIERRRKKDKKTEQIKDKETKNKIDEEPKQKKDEGRIRKEFRSKRDLGRLYSICKDIIIEEKENLDDQILFKEFKKRYDKNKKIEKETRPVRIGNTYIKNDTITPRNRMDPSMFIVEESPGVKRSKPFTNTTNPNGYANLEKPKKIDYSQYIVK